MDQDIQLINRKLAENYGHSVAYYSPFGTVELSADSRPRFRISWSTDQLEERLGKFEIYYGSIFLRTEVGIRRLPKYMLYQNYWVLEELVYCPDATMPESMKGHYELRWVFRDKEKVGRRPIWRFVDVLVLSIVNPDGLGDAFADEEAEFNKEVDLFTDILDNESPTMAGMIGRGQAILNPHGAMKYNVNP